MNTLPSPVEQLANLGYDLVNGAMRFEAAMSMGASIIVRDEKGNDLQITSNEGQLVVGAAAGKQGLTLPAMMVRRNNRQPCNSEGAMSIPPAHVAKKPNVPAVMMRLLARSQK
ncbi:hypothetical protein [Pseudomonas sp. On1]|uniref:hypothetical protein n=1 Tax=Pseudomonas sp. On1 TaxID=3083258 RepID=UPI0029B1C289|nr:hypothetical protein [Pseudomonas sp. On1]MDX2309899.1 hypothetical protein [Pseudomonas sp. On1]